jgi:hypothetical protein
LLPEAAVHVEHRRARDRVLRATVEADGLVDAMWWQRWTPRVTTRIFGASYAASPRVPTPHSLVGMVARLSQAPAAHGGGWWNVALKANSDARLAGFSAICALDAEHRTVAGIEGYYAFASRNDSFCLAVRHRMRVAHQPEHDIDLAASFNAYARATLSVRAHLTPRTEFAARLAHNLGSSESDVRYALAYHAQFASVRVVVDPVWLLGHSPDPKDTPTRASAHCPEGPLTLCVERSEPLGPIRSVALCVDVMGRVGVAVQV